jgi:hypothetical protein
MNFFIEQIALCPPNPEKAIALLCELGLDTWVTDHVVAGGKVFGNAGGNEADLAFNYQNTREGNKPLELEVLHYTQGPNWMAGRPPMVSHLGMHCTAEELDKFRRKFADMGITVAQEVFTQSHTNPFLLETGRKYQYVIFDTRDILGTDLKFIVRREKPEVGTEAAAT